MTELSLSPWIALPVALLLICGGLVTLIGAFGLLRLRDFYSRMHPPTMGMGLGVTCVLVSSMLISSAALDRWVIHEIIIGLFIMLTTPVTAITLMRAALSRTAPNRPGAPDPPPE
jgi:multicomponent K+:H+ antiporter subunit G